MITTIKAAKEAIGSDLGRPSKMPGFSYGISPHECDVGNKLSRVEGSSCADCYAKKGNYPTPSVVRSHIRRLTAWRSDPTRWIEGMIFLINKRTEQSGEKYFRGHDSGDFQSVKHVLAWVQVAQGCPTVDFWIPSREYARVRHAINIMGKAWPVNLLIRVSMPMIGMKPTTRMAAQFVTSTIDANTGHPCPAPTQGNECGSCRACWDPNVPNVDYHKH